MTSGKQISNPFEAVIITEDSMGNLTIIYSDGKSFYIQTDYEKANFGINCGLIKAPPNWTGIPDELPENWWEQDWEDITEVPDYYKAFAE